MKHFILGSLSVALVTDPIVLLVFAVLALGLTLANHFISQHLDKEKPKIKMAQVSGKMTFFKSSEFACVESSGLSPLPSLEKRPI